MDGVKLFEYVVVCLGMWCDVFEFVIFMYFIYAVSMAARIWSTCVVVFIDVIDELCLS